MRSEHKRTHASTRILEVGARHDGVELTFFQICTIAHQVFALSEQKHTGIQIYICRKEQSQ